MEVVRPRRAFSHRSNRVVSGCPEGRRVALAHREGFGAWSLRGLSSGSSRSLPDEEVRARDSYSRGLWPEASLEEGY